MRIILEDKPGDGRKLRRVVFADKRDRKRERRNKRDRQRAMGAIL